MTRKTFTKIGMFIGLVVFMPIAMSHHSFIAQYDPEQPVTLTGVVTKIDWMNPHVYFYIDVKDPTTGTIENWGIEMGPPHMLQKRGWKRNSMQIGDVIEIEGARARNGSTNANARKVTMTATGIVLGTASSGQTITSGKSD